jgi:D-alanyl-D-alanine carboxypeptidase
MASAPAPQGGDAPALSDRGHRPPSRRLIVVAIVSSLFVVMIGAFAWYDNRQRDHEEKCLSDWAATIAETVQIRSEGTEDLRKAQKRKGEADDAVTQVFVAAFLTTPPPPKPQLEDQFRAALSEFVKAKANLATVQARVDKIVAAHPYPTLDLGCAT